MDTKDMERLKVLLPEETIESRKERIRQIKEEREELEAKMRELKALIGRRAKRIFDAQELINRQMNRNQRDGKRIEYLKGEIERKTGILSDLRTPVNIIE